MAVASRRAPDRQRRYGHCVPRTVAGFPRFIRRGRQGVAAHPVAGQAAASDARAAGGDDAAGVGTLARWRPQSRCRHHPRRCRRQLARPPALSRRRHDEYQGRRRFPRAAGALCQGIGWHHNPRRGEPAAGGSDRRERAVGRSARDDGSVCRRCTCRFHCRIDLRAGADLRIAPFCRDGARRKRLISEGREVLMIYSTDRILTTHAGSLPRPPGLMDMVLARARGEPHDQAALGAQLRSAVADVVERQVACGLDIVNDGELSKPNFTDYVLSRIAGCESRPGSGDRRLSITARDERKFPEYFQAHPRPRYAGGQTVPVCVGELRYVGQAELGRDIENFKAALAGTSTVGAFLPANTPGTIEHWLKNEHYKSDEEFLLAIAEAMREEYKAIVDAGFLLQIDDPDLPDGWNCLPDIGLADYRKYATVRVDALNHALRDIPEEQIRLHVCWGSGLGPHKNDVDLRDIIDIILRVKAQVYSIEAANPRHQHEWRVFEEVKLPEGKSLMPGVVGHATDIIEHPELVADRLVRYANLVGRENVIAGTDCGIGSRVGHAEIAWAKLEDMAKGAALATQQLWR